MNDKLLNSILILHQKETLLSEIIAWLKGRGIWEECAKDIGITGKPEGLGEKS